MGGRNLAEKGATAIEYGLIAALVAVVIITGLTALGSSLNNKFNSVASEVESSAPGDSDSTRSEDPTDQVEPTSTMTATAVATATMAEVTVESTAAPEVVNEGLCWLGPGNEYEVVSALKAEMSVEVKGIGMRQSWLVIDNPHYPGVMCWVQEDLVDIPPDFTLPGTIYAVPTIAVPTSIPSTGSGRQTACWVAGECMSPCPDPEVYNPCSQ